MIKLKVKTGDTVLVISGKDRGRKGKITKVFPKAVKLIVEGMNMRKRHVKPRKSGEKGQIVSKEAPFSLSNVKLMCPKCQKAVRVGWKTVGQKKSRVCKKCGETI
ncbi:MAG: 50S ribosomal protein L24 [Candidatus Wildermuthbacteria bacterium RIFCSPHIGHO2_01_FULL_48_25]|uniref:Large ribosomal subunit protein uL24 n=1 Tax=Candidatus Wildermuthbacteria bacterium RIFCSPLOWO2_01_FULL_48_16 TaxID=1802461 RepID=A0A1G2RKV0_9BACT|nr:MAG: 50S ribosomal protein L24 [Candidatus Wildermuthbacteria bacterium RIFCSPHIGHO2_01_FULL_48_25]OHA69065.1 MAG: 50S ribosomal protein L24 [Candidatus Wildermuthbacteria bacterium RIFCSPHIGHO2_02_FULL_49_12b]OHA73475.1 MAG: 50S ribosomal protein L24 [Candidatus Wildermuthbacteria bacterium RIFCSPLOWO2_01_FULL_48_16]